MNKRVRANGAPYDNFSLVIYIVILIIMLMIIHTYVVISFSIDYRPEILVVILKIYSYILLNIFFAHRMSLSVANYYYLRPQPHWHRDHLPHLGSMLYALRHVNIYKLIYMIRTKNQNYATSILTAERFKSSTLNI